MTDTEVLVSMRELLSSPERWCRGDMARKKNSRSTCGCDPEACQWCIVGALVRFTDADQCDRIHAFLNKEVETFTGSNVARFNVVECFNDSFSTTHDRLLGFLDHCIAAKGGKVVSRDGEASG